MTEEECMALAKFGELLKKVCDDFVEVQLKLDKIFNDILSLLEEEQESTVEEYNNGRANVSIKSDGNIK